MATLKLTWKSSEVYDLWSFGAGATHQVARMLKRHRENLYSGLVGPLGQEPSRLVIFKLARGEEAMKGLEWEAGFYTTELLPLQGTVVPRFYGLYHTKIKGVDFGCTILEFCVRPNPTVGLSAREFNEKVMVATCKLHQAGVVHNNLLQSDRHFILKGLEIVIVDFAQARRHKCNNAVPTLYNSRPAGAFCSELVDMERAYGIYSDPPSVSRASFAASVCWG